MKSGVASSDGEPHRLAAGADLVAAPARRQLVDDEEAPAVGVLGPWVPYLRWVVDVVIDHRHADAAVLYVDGDLERGGGVPHRVGDELAHQQEDRVGVASEGLPGEGFGDELPGRPHVQCLWLESSPTLAAPNATGGRFVLHRPFAYPVADEIIPEALGRRASRGPAVDPHHHGSAGVVGARVPDVERQALLVLHQIGPLELGPRYGQGS